MNSLEHWIEYHVKEAIYAALPSYRIPDKLQTVGWCGGVNGDYKLVSFIGIHKSLERQGWSGSIQKLFDEIYSHFSPDFLEQVKVILNDRHQISFALSPPLVQKQLERLLTISESMLIPPTKSYKRILVDFSSPNIAKHLHVGHLRSTILGESICRLLEAQGHTVFRVNHIGDFGLQFGMLIQEILDRDLDVAELTMDDLQEIYVASKKHFDKDIEFQRQAYEKVICLQQGDIATTDPSVTVGIWHAIKDISRTSYNDIYERLGATLKEVGESFYQPLIPDLVEELNREGLLEESDGRQIIRITGHRLPLTVVKSDGGYTYDTTDLAALKYRLVNLGVDAVYYVVGLEQAEHFKLLFKAAKKIGWARGKELQHFEFGMILGESGGKMKSREGGVVTLTSLLDQALVETSVTCASKSKFNSFAPEQQAEIVRAVAYSAVKYADLSVNRTKNYKFSHKRMLNLKGNTAPFLMYAYTRVVSILQKAGDFIEKLRGSSMALHEAEVDVASLYVLGEGSFIKGLEDFSECTPESTSESEDIYVPEEVQEREIQDLLERHSESVSRDSKEEIPPSLALSPAYEYLRSDIYSGANWPLEPCELALGKTLLRFSEVLDKVQEDFQFYHLSDYLYSIADAFHSFHGRVRCLEYNKEREPVKVHSHRLQLCEATRKVLVQGFWLLGLEPLKKM